MIVFPKFCYFRGKRNQKAGVIVALRVDSDNVSIGWSKCNPVDKFDRDAGIDLAVQRAKDLASKGSCDPPLPCMVPQLNKFTNQMRVHFKDCKFLTPQQK